MNVIYKLILGSTLFFYSLIPIATFAKAAETSSIVTVVVKSNGDGANTLVESGAVLSSEDKIRLQIRPATNGRISVEFSGPGRPPALIVDEQAVFKERSLSLPSVDGWYDLDGTTGMANFKVMINSDGGSRQSSFHFFLAPRAFKKVDFSDGAGTSIDKGSPVSVGIHSAVNEQDATDNVAAAIPVLERLLNSKSTALRGAVGAKLYKKYSKSVVLIITKDGMGSGALVDKNGLVVTNWHVISGFKRVAVVVKPNIGEKVKKKDILIGDVVRVDEVSDLALVRIPNFPSNIVPIPMGKLSEIEVGADVHAIGHPTGENWTYTQGIVSQVRGEYKWKTGLNVEHIATVIQTQTPINPGNSGGPLFNDLGQLIGINSFVRKNSEGLNFAVSIRDVGIFMARTKSRRAKKSKTVKKKCELKTIKVDKDKNGIPEKYLMDSNCDGKIDTIVLDENEDGNPEVVLKDTNGDGKINLKVIKSKPDKPFDIWLMDNNGDNKPDVAGVDTNGDGKPDKFRKLS